MQQAVTDTSGPSLCCGALLLCSSTMSPKFYLASPDPQKSTKVDKSAGFQGAGPDVVNKLRISANMKANIISVFMC